MERKSERPPAVSVLLPVYNGMPYIGEAIDSIAAQTEDAWDLVIVDNASTDGTFEYLQGRAEAEPRIVLLRNESNIGLVGSLNRGLEHCRAPWVARIDADDRALPDRLERQLAFVAANPRVITTSCLAHYVNAQGRRLGVTTSDLTTQADYKRYMASGRPIILLHPGAFIRSDLLLSVGGYRAEFYPAEDVDLWSRLSERGMVLVQPEYLMEYRVHGRSIIAQSFEKARLKQEYAVACMIARRENKPEPSWTAFEAAWHGAPLIERLGRGRRILAERLARAAREEVASGRRATGFAKLAFAAALRPLYSAPRLMSHVRHSGLQPSPRALQGHQ